MKKLSVLSFFSALLSLLLALLLFSGLAQAYVYDTINLTDDGPDTGYFTYTPGSYPLSFSTNAQIIDKLGSTSPISGAFTVVMQYSGFDAINTTKPSAGNEFVGSSIDLQVGFSGSSPNLASVYEYTDGNGTYFEALKYVGTTKTHLYLPTPGPDAKGVTNGWLAISYNGKSGSGGMLTLMYSLNDITWNTLGTWDPGWTADPYFFVEGYNPDGTSLEFEVNAIDIVPLPPSLFLLGSGLLGLGALGWRRQQG